jgi:hypothetical protein
VWSTKQVALGLLVAALVIAALVIAAVFVVGGTGRDGEQVPIAPPQASTATDERASANNSDVRRSLAPVAPHEDVSTTPAAEPLSPAPTSEAAASLSPLVAEPWHASVPREATPAWIFEERYRDYSLEQLKQARDASVAKFNDAQNRAFKERHDAGAYHVVPYADGAGPKGGYGFKLKQKGGDPLAQLVNVGDANSCHVVWLPFAEYPDVYEAMDEWHWLANAIWKQENPTTTAASVGG